MRSYLTQEEMNKIERLAECALSADNKKEAQNYIKQMQFAISGILGSSRSILIEMISEVDHASGMVSNKESKVSVARQLIIKAQMFCVEQS